jgi:uncharacterized membrane protein
VHTRLIAITNSVDARVSNTQQILLTHSSFMDRRIETSDFSRQKKYSVDRPASCRLAPLDTSYSYTSQSSSSTTSSTISAHQFLPPNGRRNLLNIPSAKERLNPRGMFTEEKNVVSPLQLRFSFHDQNYQTNQLIPSTPPLSARSAAFFISLRHSLRHSFLSAVDAYVHRRFNHSEKSPPCQRTRFTDSKLENLEEQSTTNTKSPLSSRRKCVAVVFGTLMAISMAMTIFFASAHHILHPGTANHFIMGGSGSIIIFAAIVMLATRRSIKEVLAMAAVAVTVCQCIMADLKSDT